MSSPQDKLITYLYKQAARVSGLRNVSQVGELWDDDKKHKDGIIRRKNTTKDRQYAHITI